MNDKIKQDNDTRLQDNETCVTEHIPQVSVCMPMYNASKYLRECIDSVLAKTFKDFEFLIVDDGSDDVHFHHICYADSPRHAVINHNGDVFKCTARDFATESREGRLNNEGRIEWNEKFFQRMAIKYSNEACRNCVILPICNGRCTQNKIEAGLKNTCFLSMTEDAKQDYLKARVNEIIKACIKQKIHNSTQK